MPSPLCEKNDAQKTVIKKWPFSKTNTGPTNSHQTSDSCDKRCQRRNRQLSAREKHSDVSQMWNQTLLIDMHTCAHA